MVGIYKITNIINNKCYIGQSVDIHKRWISHKASSFNPNRSDYNTPLHRAMRKHGLSNFLFEIVEECSKSVLSEREIYYITYYHANNDNFGYNIERGGQGASHGIKLSKEIVKQIINHIKNTNDSFVKIGKMFGVAHNMIIWINRGELWHDDAEKYPIRIQTKPHTTPKTHNCLICGNKISAKYQYCNHCVQKVNGNKIRKAARPTSLELARMIKECGFETIGEKYGVTGNAVRKWCKAYGIPHTKKELIIWYNEQVGIVNISKSRKTKADYMIPVKQIDIHTENIIHVFPSLREAARSVGNKNITNIINVCKGKNKTAYGYRWQYA